MKKKIVCKVSVLLMKICKGHVLSQYILGIIFFFFSLLQPNPLQSRPWFSSLWDWTVLCHPHRYKTRHRNSPVSCRDDQRLVSVDQTHSQWMSCLSRDDQRSQYKWVATCNTWTDRHSFIHSRVVTIPIPVDLYDSRYHDKNPKTEPTYF